MHKKNKLKGGGGNNPEELSNLQPSQGEQLPREGKVWARRAGDAVNAFLPGTAAASGSFRSPPGSQAGFPGLVPSVRGILEEAAGPERAAVATAHAGQEIAWEVL